MKRIIICSDGTWNTPDQESPSNVTEIARAVLPTGPDGTPQVVFYDAGVGTESSPLLRMLGGVSGKGIEKNIRDCYRFLMHNYEEGDEIYLFGFSREAYTVRSLVGMARNVGVLEKSEASRIPEAFRMYRRSDAKPRSEEATRFRDRYSREVTITFIGVWDTVGALGVPLRRLGRLTSSRHQFHDVELSRIVKHACHALAIDEKRGPFRASLWKAAVKQGQTVEQVWFPGVHGDVGGTQGDSSLANAPLEWMKARASALGLVLDKTGVPQSTDTSPPAIGDQGFWDLLPSHPREVGGDATQSVHPTARNRFRTVESYKPVNLAEYLARPDARIYGEGED